MHKFCNKAECVMTQVLFSFKNLSLVYLQIPPTKLDDLKFKIQEQLDEVN